jgi:hypothetical protein
VPADSLISAYDVQKYSSVFPCLRERQGPAVPVGENDRSRGGNVFDAKAHTFVDFRVFDCNLENFSVRDAFIIDGASRLPELSVFREIADPDVLIYEPGNELLLRLEFVSRSRSSLLIFTSPNTVFPAAPGYDFASTLFFPGGNFSNVREWDTVCEPMSPPRSFTFLTNSFLSSS